MKIILPVLIIVLGFLSACANSSSESTIAKGVLEDNKKVAVSYIEEVVNHRKLELVEEIFSPDYVRHEWNGNTTSNIKDGSLIAFLKYLFKAFPDLHYTIVDVIAEGDMVALNLLAKGTHQNEFLGFEASGSTVTYQEMFFFKLKNQKIVEGWSVVDVEQVKAQLEKH